MTRQLYPDFTESEFRQIPSCHLPRDVQPQRQSTVVALSRCHYCHVRGDLRPIKVNKLQFY